MPGQQISARAGWPCAYSALRVGARGAVLSGAPPSAARGRDCQVGPVIMVGVLEVAVAIPTFSVSSEADHSRSLFPCFPIHKAVKLNVVQSLFSASRCRDYAVSWLLQDAVA